MSQNYRALTRTYRPQSFDDIVSQEHVSNTLKNAIRQDRLSHAYMFCGPRGVGKTTMARVLARTINSIGADVDAESLNQTLNVVEIDAASNNKVDDIHHLRESVRIPPQNGRYKVFIVDEVHMLSKAAFNALLKTLEEPPSHAIFIFATTEPHKVLPTILSRVQRFDFKRISVDEIVSRLQKISQKEGIAIDEESLHVIAKKADGALRDALGLMDQAIAFCGDTIRYDELIDALNVVGSEHLFQFVNFIEKKDSTGGLQLVDDLMQGGVDIQEFLAALTEHLRNLYVAIHSTRMNLVDATRETKERYRKTAEAFTEEDLMRMLHMVSDAQMKIRDVQQPRVHFEILLLKLIHMNRSRELNALIEDLSQLKKNGRIQLKDDPNSDSETLTKSNSSSNHEASSVSEPVDNRMDTLSREDEPAGYSSTNDSEDNSRPQQNNGSQPNKKNSEGNAGDRDQSEIISENQPESFHEDKKKRPEASPIPGAETSSPETSGNNSGNGDHEEDEDDFLMIKPTLGFAEGISSSHGELDEEALAETAVLEEETAEPARLNSADDLGEYWEEFVNEVKQSAPQLLYMQLLRVKLKQLKGTQLIVSADSEFASDQFRENEDLLAGIMKKVVGTRIRIKCIVERSEKKKQAQSPYERFKELQKKDPHLKSVVELFGAELDY